MQKAEKPKMAKYVRNLLRNGVKASRPSTLIVTDVLWIMVGRFKNLVRKSILRHL